MEKPDALWGTVVGAVLAAAIGSFLIIANEWVKVLFEKKKEKKKLKIWNALEQTGPSARWLAIEHLSEETGIDVEEIKPLIYEMLREGTVFEAPMAGKFMRHRE
jgi:gas vesicle protein